MINGIGSSYSSYYSSSGRNRSTDSATIEATGNEENPLKKRLKALDSDGNGSINKAELTAVATEADCQEEETADTIDVDQLLGLLDQDSDGSLTESELVNAFTLLSPSSTYASYDTADDLIFNLDSDGSDTLSSSELEALSELSGTTLLSALDSDEMDRSELSETLQAAMMPVEPKRPPVKATQQTDTASAAYVQVVQTFLRQYQTVADYKPEATKRSKINVSV
ncbi:EF hand domain-containing protein [Pseudomonas duriflava]|uniref:EF hand domain-containing protein n=1 Tax=Pseudomonas duriflava TaxID=459528 RepID=A0A562QFQ3_9PSED|nr:EF-hand domain-containing protein [Pseudomonas duriflava]TWI55000.1 EF hand domain-containing protein [Pseudomonas duriflava]